jgi:hypothetical protein
MLGMNKDTIQTIISICILFGIVFGAITYFATASDLDQVAMRLEQKITGDKIFVLQQRIWQLEDRYPGQPNCSTWRGPTADRDRKEYRRLKMELEQLQKMQRKGS